MTVDVDPLTLRCLPEGHLVVTRDSLDLGRFLTTSSPRRARYFDAIDLVYGAFEASIGSAPPELAVRSALAHALALDREFRGFVCDQGGVALAMDPASWERTITAGAGTFLCEFLRARENGRENGESA